MQLWLFLNKNPEFDADFEFVENDAEKFAWNKFIRTFAGNLKMKNQSKL